MTGVGAKRARIALAVLLSVVFAVLAHQAVVDAFSPTVGAALALVPAALVAVWLLRRAVGRAVAGLAVAAALAALWAGWGGIERHFRDMFFAEHAGAMLALALVFGRTLFAGREPLCTRFARITHGKLEPEVERYTRRLTGAWALLFSALFALSCILYLGGWLAPWSLLAGALTPLAIVAMFLIEYAVRLRALPDHEHIGILGGIRAFARHFARPSAQAQR